MNNIDSNIRTIFCNGLNTTHCEAREGAEQIGKILGKNVSLFYNNGTGDVPMGVATTSLAVVASLLLMNPLPLFVTGGASLMAVDKRKHDLATILAKKICCYLQKNPLNRVSLIAHSQGRDIISKALGNLNNYKNKISVIVLGSEPIGLTAAKKVTNFQVVGDIVPFLMDIRDLNLMKPRGDITYLPQIGYGILDNHTLKECYLENNHVQDCIKSIYSDFKKEIRYQQLVTSQKLMAHPNRNRRSAAVSN